jgi:hypothetical protein
MVLPQQGGEVGNDGVGSERESLSDARELKIARQFPIPPIAISLLRWAEE